MSKIFLTSDWHFLHDREFVWKVRGFDSVNAMNEAIIERHNAAVSADDDVYVLGDLSLGGGGNDVLETAQHLIERLNGRIHIVLGNHDTPKRIEMYQRCANVVEVCGYATMLHYKGYHLYLSHFPTLTANFDEDKPLKTKVINICGHKHTENKFEDIELGIIYHVEQDAHQCFPINIDTIIEDIKHFGQ